MAGLFKKPNGSGEESTFPGFGGLGNISEAIKAAKDIAAYFGTLQESLNRIESQNLLIMNQIGIDISAFVPEHARIKAPEAKPETQETDDERKIA